MARIGPFFERLQNDRNRGTRPRGIGKVRFMTQTSTIQTETPRGDRRAARTSLPTASSRALVRSRPLRPH
jgi:hypothetical protein